MSFSPNVGWLLVKPAEDEKTTTSGIILSAASGPIKRFEVVANGIEPNEGTDCYVEGDIVLFDERSGRNIVVDGKPHLLVRHVDVFGEFV